MDREARRQKRREALDDLTNFRIQSKATRKLNEDMLQWMTEFTMGNTKTNLFLCEIADFPGGLRGMRSKTNIKKGQKILWLPMERLVVNAIIVLEDSVVQRFLKATHPPDLQYTMEHLFFIFLIAHKRKGRISRYATYINSLPKSYDTPIMWDDHQINTMTKDEAKIVFDEIDKVWEIFAIIKESLETACILNDIDFYTDFLWAYNVVKTRGFECRLEERYRFRVNKLRLENPAFTEKFDLTHLSVNYLLCPYLDMVNHSTILVNADVEHDIVNQDWALYATKDIRIGEQIFISYGEDSTSNTFITYGFIDDSAKNPHEKVFFEPEDFSSYPQVQQRIIDVGLYDPEDPKDNLLSISSEIGCSWGLQRAAILAIIQEPSEAGIDSWDDFFSAPIRVTGQQRKEANELLRKVLRKRVLKFRDLVKNLDENVMFQKGNDMIKTLYEVQSKFLVEFLEENEKLYVLMGSFDSDSQDSGNEGC